MLPWTWQNCRRCEGQQESHTLIKDQGAKNKTPPVGTTPRDSRRCEKAQYTRFNYHACTLELLLCINVSWTGCLLRYPLVVRNVPQCTWFLNSSQYWQQESHGMNEKTVLRRKHFMIACEPKLER